MKDRVVGIACSKCYRPVGNLIGETRPNLCKCPDIAERMQGVMPDDILRVLGISSEIAYSNLPPVQYQGAVG